MNIFDWNTISEKQKKSLSKLKPIFILASRDLSEKRIFELTKKLGSKRSVVWGVAKEKYVDGLEGSEQFRMLNTVKLTDGITNYEQQVTRPQLPVTNYEVSTLNYFQRDVKYILKELNFSAVIFVNGSWSRALHFREEFWAVINKKIEYKFISPFSNEEEARNFKFINYNFKFIEDLIGSQAKDEVEIFNLVDKVKSLSFDWIAQIGAVLVKDNVVISAGYNKVMPYDSYTLHFGSSREKNFTPLGDQNHYDTNHAEVEVILNALKRQKDVSDSTLYINVMPCPSCARMIADSGISKVVYRLEHSEGYASKLFGEMGVELIINN